MSKKEIRTDGAPSPIGPYSQAIETGSMVFCSGQIPLNSKTGELVGVGREKDIAAQTRQVMDNLNAVLTAAGLTFDNVVKTGIFLKSMNDFGTVNEVYGTYFEGMIPPARACVEVARLPKDVDVEIECIASRN